jgi:hypothetical protein
MRLLGIGGLDHNGSAAVVADGRVISVSEAERVAWFQGGDEAGPGLSGIGASWCRRRRATPGTA